MGLGAAATLPASRTTQPFWRRGAAAQAPFVATNLLSVSIIIVMLMRKQNKKA